MVDSNSVLRADVDENAAALPAFQIPKIEETIRNERRSGRRFWLFFLAALLIGYFGAQLFSNSRAMPDPDRVRLSRWQGVILIMSLPASAFIVLLAHEMGHVIGGRLAGLKFLFLVVGPMKVTRSKTGLKWELNRSIALAGGLACCVPSDPKHFLRPLRWMVIGGPIASFLLMVVCYFCSTSVDSLPFTPSWNLFTSSSLKITALLSLMIGLLTSYPGMSANMKTDGRQFLELLRSNPHARRQNLVRLLVGQSLAGVRPSEWNSNVVAELETAYSELEDDEAVLPERVVWSSLRSAVAVDQNDITTAHELIQFNLTHSGFYPVFARGTLFLDAALFEARVRKDADAAEALIQAAPDGMMVESYLLPAAQAEVSWLREDVAAAKALAQQALDAMSVALDAGSVVKEREHLVAIINATKVDESSH